MATITDAQLASSNKELHLRITATNMHDYELYEIKLSRVVNNKESTLASIVAQVITPDFSNAELFFIRAHFKLSSNVILQSNQSAVSALSPEYIEINMTFDSPQLSKYSITNLGKRLNPW